MAKHSGPCDLQSAPNGYLTCRFGCGKKIRDPKKKQNVQVIKTSILPFKSRKKDKQIGKTIQEGKKKK